MLNIYAIYFPQFYVTDENSKWWGKDFTDWDLVKKAEPLFPNHYQPRDPLLGHVDQSLEETIVKQVELAKEYGIDGFNFYHYWFNGVPYLDVPLKNFINSKINNFDFFLTWANESWTRQWVGKPNEYLIKQKYYNNNFEIEQHYSYLSSFFRDSRYKKINNKPVYCIYRPELIPNLNNVLEHLNKLAINDGFLGIYFVAFRSYDIPYQELLYASFDAILNFNPRYCINKNLKNRSKSYLDKYLRLLPEKMQSNLALVKSKFQKETVYDYREYVESIKNTETYFGSLPIYESVFPDWDNTARYSNRATFFNNVSNDLFLESLKIAINKQSKFKEKMLFINAWNEWSESAYIEPDNKFGYEKIKIIKSIKNDILNN
ncbi:glycoside hydrolase family 99-like domain-containing protein [Photobacterium damselae]|uniref:glycosyltransferase WbsX family protein n=1 Tax=Photobacterium damselae TaxID=38293 RepID=UPI001243E404|nr:glycoside hydrolase family 99-like domain-containing protein [Photobacterium damselae]KAB1182866.1 hypothetical protein F6477_01680 [Photobacterium damselae subsp. damselae]MBF7101632.1 hypothetical protein [Photobacterium damselae]USR76623.1 glycoside hydrolase family 99-like domain-containing protein [Photobacterium damselae]